MSGHTELLSDTLAEIISYDYETNSKHNRNTIDEYYTIDTIPKETFNEFVNKFLISNKFNYRDIKIEYDDEVQLFTYLFPSFIHLICTPILFCLYYKPAKYADPEAAEGGPEENKIIGLKNAIQENVSNLIVSYFQVNNFLGILMNSKNKVALLNKDLLIIPDGVILNPSLLTEPIFSIEVTSTSNLEKMRYKLSHSYTRFKRPNSYKTIVLLIYDDSYDVTVEVWKKVPLNGKLDGYLNIPPTLDRQNELQKAAIAIESALYLNLDPTKHKFAYYLQNKPYEISYDSCKFFKKDEEKNGIMFHYFDIHPELDDPDAGVHKNAFVTLHFDEIRILVGHLIRKKMSDLKSDASCLSVAEQIRNRAKKSYFDLCDLDFPSV